MEDYITRDEFLEAISKFEKSIASQISKSSQESTDLLIESGINNVNKLRADVEDYFKDLYFAQEKRHVIFENETRIKLDDHEKRLISLEARDETAITKWIRVNAWKIYLIIAIAISILTFGIVSYFKTTKP